MKDALNSGSFRNPDFNHVVFGNDINIEIIDGKVYVNGQVMNDLKPEEVFRDGPISYIDFDPKKLAGAESVGLFCLLGSCPEARFLTRKNEKITKIG